MTFWNNPSNLLPKQKHRWVISFENRDLETGDSAPSFNKISKYFAKSVDRPAYEIQMQQAKYLYSHTFNFPKRLTWKPIQIVFYDTLIRDSVNIIKQTKYSNSKQVELSNGTFYDAGPIIYGDSVTISDPRDVVNVKEKKLLTYKNGVVSENGREAEYETGEANASTQLFFYNFLKDIGYNNPEELDREDKLLRFRKFNFKQDMIKSLVGSEIEELDYFGGVPVDTKTWPTLKIQELNEEGKATETWNLYNCLINSVNFDKLDYSSEDILKITVGIHYDWATLEAGTNTIKNTENKTERSDKPITGTPFDSRRQQEINLNSIIDDLAASLAPKDEKKESEPSVQTSRYDDESFADEVDPPLTPRDFVGQPAPIGKEDFAADVDPPFKKTSEADKQEEARNILARSNDFERDDGTSDWAKEVVEKGANVEAQKPINITPIDPNSPAGLQAAKQKEQAKLAEEQQKVQAYKQKFVDQAVAARLNLFKEKQEKATEEFKKIAEKGVETYTQELQEALSGVVINAQKVNTLQENLETSKKSLEQYNNYKISILEEARKEAEEEFEIKYGDRDRLTPEQLVGLNKSFANQFIAAGLQGTGVQAAYERYRELGLLVEDKPEAERTPPEDIEISRRIIQRENFFKLLKTEEEDRQKNRERENELAIKRAAEEQALAVIREAERSKATSEIRERFKGLPEEDIIPLLQRYEAAGLGKQGTKQKDIDKFFTQLEKEQPLSTIEGAEVLTPEQRRTLNTGLATARASEKRGEHQKITDWYKQRVQQLSQENLQNLQIEESLRESFRMRVAPTIYDQYSSLNTRQRLEILEYQQNLRRQENYRNREGEINRLVAKYIREATQK